MSVVRLPQKRPVGSKETKAGRRLPLSEVPCHKEHGTQSLPVSDSELFGNARYMLAEEFCAFEFVGVRLAGAVACGDGRGAVG